jgi:hypothetical protein
MIDGIMSRIRKPKRNMNYNALEVKVLNLKVQTSVSFLFYDYFSFFVAEVFSSLILSAIQMHVSNYAYFPY